jgi:hypothetical protein
MKCLWINKWKQACAFVTPIMDLAAEPMKGLSISYGELQPSFHNAMISNATLGEHKRPPYYYPVERCPRPRVELRYCNSLGSFTPPKSTRTVTTIVQQNNIVARLEWALAINQEQACPKNQEDA